VRRLGRDRRDPDGGPAVQVERVDLRDGDLELT
jgi:hypothetical protein